MSKTGFFQITDKGGYIGRFYWQNTGVHHEQEHWWGEMYWIKASSILNSFWAGDLWVIRVLIGRR
jgi:hypothetical protein